EDDVGMQLPEQVHGFLAVAGFSCQHDVGLIPENRSDSFPHQREVFCAQNTDGSFLRHDSASAFSICATRAAAGSRTVTVVPRPGSLCSSRCAPIWVARSFIPMIP